MKWYTCSHVRDLPQKARLVGHQIQVASFVGRRKVSAYSFQRSQWDECETIGNPAWDRIQLIRSLTEQYDQEPGGPEQADRIRDAQIAAIRAALKTPPP